MRVDTHCHTEFSFDGSGKMREHCQSAVDKGLNVICFTDHIDIEPPIATLSTFNFARRYTQYLRCKERFPQLQILFGLEFAEPNRNYKQFCSVMGAYPYDFVLGSVHTPCEYYFHTHDGAQTTREHYERTKELASSGLCDCLAHLDFPKKFIPNFTIDRDMTSQILIELIKHDTSLEVNYSTLRRGLCDPCPDSHALYEYLSLGGRYITLGSDSHAPLDIAVPYDEALSHIPQGLITCYYVQRKRVTFTE